MKQINKKNERENTFIFNSKFISTNNPLVMNQIRRMNKAQKPSITCRRDWPTVHYQKNNETVTIQMKNQPSSESSNSNIDPNIETYRRCSLKLNKIQYLQALNSE